MRAGMVGRSRGIIRAATEKGLTVGTAESLTGGMIASALAGVPGASPVLMGGIVSYDPRVKRELLGVTQEVIDSVGVVSEPSARQMALGAREKLGVDIAVSATGLAGPGRGGERNPVGTVFLGIAGKEGVRVVERRFTGGRQQVRRKAAAAALQMVWDEIDHW